MVQIRQNGVSRGQQHAHPKKTVQVYSRDDFPSFAPPQEGDGTEAQEIRNVPLGKYGYALMHEWETDNHWVVCTDLERPNVKHRHGPLTEQEGNAFIDTRVQRVEDLRRD